MSKRRIIQPDEIPEGNGEEKVAAPKTQGEIEIQNRRQQVIELHSKGLTQAEIAKELSVDQAEVRRDLDHMRKDARKYIERYIAEDIPFEYYNCVTGLDQIIKRLWDRADDENASHRDRMRALAMATQCYQVKLELLVGGPKSDMNARLHMKKIKHNEWYVQSHPESEMMAGPQFP